MRKHDILYFFHSENAFILKLRPPCTATRSLVTSYHSNHKAVKPNRAVVLPTQISIPDADKTDTWFNRLTIHKLEGKVPGVSARALGVFLNL